jgi:excinuclease ABC subunit C
MSSLSEQVKLFPDSPGVYRFLDAKGGILYIGRATSLRKRVSNYFAKRIDARISEMVSLARAIKYEQTDTVLEAIILEANLIKKHWPKYNVKDKDNRSFLYVVIPKARVDSGLRRNDNTTDYPKPLVVRHRELEKFSAVKADIFGPYQSVTLIKNALKIIRRIFPYSTCNIGSNPVKSLAGDHGASKPFGKAQGKPCFDYQIGLCPGACIGAISKTEYQKNIKNIILLLSGKRELLLKRLAKAHPEKAAALRHIQDVSLITRDELVKEHSEAHRIEGYDISHLTGKETYGSMVVFTDGEADKEQYRLFVIKDVAASDDLHALEEMVVRRLRHSEWDMPDLMMIDGGRPQVDHIAGVFRKMNVTIPIVGISKYGGDVLVFPFGTKQSMRVLAESLKPVLLRVRDEAHRFAHQASRRKRDKRMHQ